MILQDSVTSFNAPLPLEMQNALYRKVSDLSTIR